MKTGLFFGSFNPVHNGHIEIANYMAEQTDLDRVWFIVSPQNPLKAKDDLLNNFHRLEMVRLAVAENTNAKRKQTIRPASAPIELQHADIEFGLPQPSYTYKTLELLIKQYPCDEFILIIGSDNLMQFHLWKNHAEILKHHQLYVYPRPDSPGGELANHPGVNMVKAPLINISSDQIRESIRRGENVNKILPRSVNDYIKETGVYD